MAEERPESSINDRAPPAGDASSFLARLGEDADALPRSFGPGAPTETPWADRIAETPSSSAASTEATSPMGRVARPVARIEPENGDAVLENTGPVNPTLPRADVVDAEAEVEPCGPPIIIDLPTRVGGVMRYLLGYLVFIAMMVLAIVLIARFAPSSIFRRTGGFAGTIALIILVSFVLGILPWIQRVRARRIARRIFSSESESDIVQLATRMWMKRPWGSGPAGMVELAKLLAFVGRLNAVFRMTRPKNFWPVHPTKWAFEPRPLDESDPTFLELADATAAESAGDAESGFEFTSPDSMPMRRVRRNIRMKGGYLSLVLMLIFWGHAAYRFYMSGRPDMIFALFSFILLTKLFGSASGSYMTAKWFLVSRGLLVDLRSMKGPVPYELFDRVRGNLVVSQVNRHTWTVVAANPRSFQATIATSREVEMILRAWSSAVAPPSNENLVALLGEGDGRNANV